MKDMLYCRGCGKPISREEAKTDTCPKHGRVYSPVLVDREGKVYSLVCFRNDQMEVLQAINAQIEKHREYFGMTKNEIVDLKSRVDKLESILNDFWIKKGGIPVKPLPDAYKEEEE